MSFTNLSKVSASTILALSLVACSSGGSHSTQAINPPILSDAEKAAAEKAAAEKAAAEKAAAEKAAAEKAAAEKAAAEKAAAEKAAAEKAAAQKAAAQKAAAEKAAAEKAAAEKAAAEKAAAEKAAAEKAAAEKAAAEKAAAEKTAAEKAAAEKAAAEKAAAEKAAAEKAAAEKAATEKAAAEKAATEKAAAEKAAAEKAATEKAAAEKAAAEKAAAEKAAAEKAAAEKAAAEKAAAEKAAAEKAAAEKAAAEKTAAEKAAAEKAAAEKAAAEKAAVLESKRLTLLNKAKQAGLDDQQAEAYAEANKEYDIVTAQKALETIIINNEKAEIANAKGISDNSYPVGQITHENNGTSSSSSSQLVTNQYGSRYTQVTEKNTKGKIIYNQAYSVVLGDYSNTEKTINGQTSFNNDLFLAINGLKTEINAIPTLGTATYSGKAFDISNDGILNYTVNFNDRIGSGSITGLGDAINLQQGSISGTGITAVATQTLKNGTYSLDFYGKKAEEIAGKVIFNGRDTVGFGGARGEISK